MLLLEAAATSTITHRRSDIKVIKKISENTNRKHSLVLLSVVQRVEK